MKTKYKPPTNKITTTVTNKYTPTKYSSLEDENRKQEYYLKLHELREYNCLK